MTAEKIMSYIRTKHLVKRVIYFPVTDSTNARAKQYAQEQSNADGILFIADAQTNGRGRRGRNWNSPAGDNIFMSLLLRPEICSTSAPMLTLVAALSVAAAAEQIADRGVQIKWPNDIVAGGKKICGILTEMSAGTDGIAYLILGIGVNVNTTVFPEELQETASSLFLETGAKKRFCRSQFVGLILEHFEYYYEQFCLAGDLSFAAEEYNRRLAGKNDTVRVLGMQMETEYAGISRGITNTGELLVELPDGSIRCVLSGEVSVRGLYHYIS